MHHHQPTPLPLYVGIPWHLTHDYATLPPIKWRWDGKGRVSCFVAGKLMAIIDCQARQVTLATDDTGLEIER